MFAVWEHEGEHQVIYKSFKVSKGTRCPFIPNYYHGFQHAVQP